MNTLVSMTYDEWISHVDLALKEVYGICHSDVNFAWQDAFFDNLTPAKAVNLYGESCDNNTARRQLD